MSFFFLQNIFFADTERLGRTSLREESFEDTEIIRRPAYRERNRWDADGTRRPAYREQKLPIEIWKRCFFRCLPAMICAACLLCGCRMRSDEPVLEPVLQEAGAAASKDGAQNGKAGEETAEKNGSGPAGIAKSAGKTGEDSYVTGDSGDTGTAQSYKAQDSLPENETEKETQDLLTVHVCGAVKKEGVYTLPAGSRIRDAIEAAGGFDKTADTSYLNLATKLEDSWQIRVPTSDEAQRLREVRDTGAAVEPAVSDGDRTALVINSGTGGGGSAAARPAGNTEEVSGEEQKININTASVEELTKIPGVGESKAKKIIEYREKNGRFESIEDIMNVTGIKENSFRKMREYITV